MSDCCNEFEFSSPQGTFYMDGGIRGKDGVTFYPHVSAAGILSWTNDGGKQNPDPVNIKGADGMSAYAAAQQAGFTGTEAQFNAYLSGIGTLTEDVDNLKSALFADEYIISLGTLVVNGQMNPETGTNKANSAKTTRTAFLQSSIPFICSLTNTDYEYCLWTYTSSSSTNKKDNPTNGVYTQLPCIVLPAGGTNRFRIGVRRVDGVNLTTDATDSTSDFYKIANAFSFTKLPSNTLYSTNDATDRTNEINCMLNTGECNLSPGVFYVTGINMPDNSALKGSGKLTQLILSNNNDSNCITLGSGCIVKDIDISGNVADFTPNSTVRGRNGIAFIGNGDNTISKGIIENCFIHDFDGSGIFCSNSGYDVDDGMSISNCYIYNCDAGLNIFRWSEFHRITGCTFTNCYYGCINNGGNNFFSCCGFNLNTIGFYLDNTDGTKINSGHSGVSSSTFAHNTEVGIKLLGVSNSGYLFSNCNASGGIYIENVGRVEFTGCRINKDFKLTVNNAAHLTWLVLFNGCHFIHNSDASSTTFDIKSNSTRFVGCFDDVGNVVDGNSFPVT